MKKGAGPYYLLASTDRFLDPGVKINAKNKKSEIRVKCKKEVKRQKTIGKTYKVSAGRVASVNIKI